MDNIDDFHKLDVCMQVKTEVFEAERCDKARPSEQSTATCKRAEKIEPEDIKEECKGTYCS